MDDYINSVPVGRLYEVDIGQRQRLIAQDADLFVAGRCKFDSKIQFQNSSRGILTRERMTTRPLDAK